MLNTKEIQYTLLVNGGEILDNINPEELASYQSIKESLKKVDVSKDNAFQEKFEKHFQFDQKRIGKKLRRRFFNLLQLQKDESTVDLRKLLRELYGNRLQRFRSKHFSIASTMLHFIHENYPIYDRNVAQLYDFSIPSGKDDSNFRKINSYLEFYNYITGTYLELLSKQKLYDLLRAIELKYGSFNMSHSKNLDLLVRTAGHMKQNGRLLSPHVSLIN